MSPASRDGQIPDTAVGIDIQTVYENGHVPAGVSFRTCGFARVWSDVAIRGVLP